jgi:hypothetical protein
MVGSTSITAVITSDDVNGKYTQCVNPRTLNEFYSSIIKPYILSSLRGLSIPDKCSINKIT